MEKNLYLLAELDENTQILIKNYEKVIVENGFIGKQTNDIPYHITLGCYSLEHEIYLRDLLDNIGKNSKQINIAYSGFGLFKLDVLYLNPAISIGLMDLYNLVKEKCCYKDHDFSAHTTLFMDEPENILKILPKFVEIFEKIQGKIKYISLYEFFPKRLIQRIELKE